MFVFLVCVLFIFLCYSCLYIVLFLLLATLLLTRHVNNNNNTRAFGMPSPHSEKGQDLALLNKKCR